MTNYEKTISMSLDKLAEFLCDNFDCDVCPAYDANYCPNSNLKICSTAMKKHLESEAEK